MKLKNWISIIGLAIPIVAFMIYSKAVSDEYKEIRKKGKKTIGEITVYGSNITCTFRIRGVEKMKEMSTPHESIRDGERYYVYYYDPIPDRYYINFSEPVIDNTLFKETRTIEIDPGGDYLFFKYQVGGKSYERYQEAIEGLQESATYPVFYNAKDPKIAYVVPSGTFPDLN